ncbi:MAG: hypothetical protein LBE22_00400, partial [Azoarcus sp.]|nr:hypothetical protein [Azoarcus sp.]
IYDKLPDQDDFILEMELFNKKIPNGKVSTTAELGKLVAEQRKAQGLTQVDLAGLGRTGSRFIGDLERGKGTVQCDKVLHILNLLGLDVVIVERRR